VLENQRKTNHAPQQENSLNQSQTLLSYNGKELDFEISKKTDHLKMDEKDLLIVSLHISQEQMTPEITTDKSTT